MASIRILKKDIDYLLEEVLSDCYFAIYYHPEKKDDVIVLMEDAVSLRNNLFERVNKPVEKNNTTLVRKHYAQIRRELFENVDNMFNKLSNITNSQAKA